jgi:hypothetical protein
MTSLCKISLAFALSLISASAANAGGAYSSEAMLSGQRLTDPELDRIRGGYARFQDGDFRLATEAVLTRSLTLHGETAAIAMDVWWSSVGLDLIVDSINRARFF